MKVSSELTHNLCHLTLQLRKLGIGEAQLLERTSDSTQVQICALWDPVLQAAS